jgi:hypothetical protein
MPVSAGPCVVAAAATPTPAPPGPPPPPPPPSSLAAASPAASSLLGGSVSGTAVGQQPLRQIHGARMQRVDSCCETSRRGTKNTLPARNAPRIPGPSHRGYPVNATPSPHSDATMTHVNCTRLEAPRPTHLANGLRTQWRTKSCSKPRLAQCVEGKPRRHISALLRSAPGPRRTRGSQHTGWARRVPGPQPWCMVLKNERNGRGGGASRRTGTRRHVYRGRVLLPCHAHPLLFGVCSQFHRTLRKRL